MRGSRFASYAASAIAILAANGLLSACGGQSVTTMPTVNGADKSLPYHKTFYYTGGRQLFRVPPGVRKLTVIAVGARGGGYQDNLALGGRVWAIIPVTPGEKLAVLVGGEGSQPRGGFNGGGSGASEPFCCRGYGGGGASDVRRGGYGLQNRILVAGGGGGEESAGFPSFGGTGGKGGGSVGGSGGDGYVGGSWAVGTAAPAARSTVAVKAASAAAIAEAGRFTVVTRELTAVSALGEAVAKAVALPATSAAVVAAAGPAITALAVVAAAAVTVAVRVAVAAVDRRTSSPARTHTTAGKAGKSIATTAWSCSIGKTVTLTALLQRPSPRRSFQRA